MILFLVFCYIIICNLLSVWASKRVLTVSDYTHASGRLSFFAAVATTFASWFGASSMLASPAVFITDGTSGLFADPYGAAACSFFVAFLLSKYIFRAKIYAIGDLYRKRYNATVELLSSLIVILSYLGWICGVITCMGLILHILSGGHLAVWVGDLIAAVMVCIYSIGGGMWSLAVTDYLQFSMIVVGFLALLFYFSGAVGGFSSLMHHVVATGRYNFFPSHEPASIFLQLSDFLALFLGLLPQQDLFQRIVACRSEKVASWSLGVVGVIYLVMSQVPLLVAFSAILIAPEIVKHYLAVDSQMVLPQFILLKTPLLFQGLFFGALFAGLLSGGGTALLAPATTISKNIVLRFFPHLNNRQILWVSRFSIVLLAFSQFLLAAAGNHSIYRIVVNCYAVTCASAAVPLLAAFFWRRANSQGAVLSTLTGFFSWVFLKCYFSVFHIPPALAAFFISLLFMVAGSLLPRMRFLGSIVRDEPTSADVESFFLTIRRR